MQHSREMVKVKSLLNELIGRRSTLAKKKEQESDIQINYTLFNQKITFEFKTHLLAAADILRKYRSFIIH